MTTLWISVNDRLPKPKRRVRVKGLYTPDGTGYPWAVYSIEWGWSSSEWRGHVGITHWLEDKKE